MAQTFGPAVSEEYSSVVFAGGGGQIQLVCLAYSWLSQIQRECLSCLFPAVFLGKVALHVVGLGVGPPCLRVDSQETLLTLTDE